MMTRQEFRPVDAKEKSVVKNLQSCHEEITKVIIQVNPEDHQCISMDGYIVFPGNYHPDGIVTYKVPRKDTDYGFDKFPEEYQEEIQKLQKELNLTKKQVAGLYKIVKTFDIKINNLEKKLDLLRTNAKQLKNNEKKKKYVNNFYKAYEKFTEYLTSDLASFEPETKNEIKKELIKLIHLIEDVIEKHLT